jgi:hypothetical protein
MAVQASVANSQKINKENNLLLKELLTNMEKTEEARPGRPAAVGLNIRPTPANSVEELELLVRDKSIVSRLSA